MKDNKKPQRLKKDGTPDLRYGGGWKGPKDKMSKGFADPKNKENINKTGVRRSIGAIIDDMRKDEVAPLTKEKLMELYKILFATPTYDLNKLKGREDTPLAVVIIIDTLLDKKTRAKAWMDYQNWLYGKAPEAGAVKDHTTDINYEKLTQVQKDAIKALDNSLEDDY